MLVNEIMVYAPLLSSESLGIGLPNTSLSFVSTTKIRLPSFFWIVILAFVNLFLESGLSFVIIT